MMFFYNKKPFYTTFLFAPILWIVVVGFVHAAPSAEEEQKDPLCYMDQKKNSLGAIIRKDGQQYQCTKVLKEKDEIIFVWVPIKLEKGSYIIDDKI